MCISDPAWASPGGNPQVSSLPGGFAEVAGWLSILGRWFGWLSEFYETQHLSGQNSCSSKPCTFPSFSLFIHSETGRRMSRVVYHLALDVHFFSVNRLHRALSEAAQSRKEVGRVLRDE